jgi:hypothetical protein
MWTEASLMPAICERPSLEVAGRLAAPLGSEISAGGREASSALRSGVNRLTAARSRWVRPPLRSLRISCRIKRKICVRRLGEAVARRARSRALLARTSTPDSMRSRSRSYWRGRRSNLVRGDPRFEADPSPDDEELLLEVEFDPEPPPEEVPPAPESLDPERSPVIELVAESSRDDPEPPPPPEAVPPVTLPVASFTVPTTFSAASSTVPVTPSAVSPTLFVRSAACPVGDVAVETAELSESAGSSWTPATALPDSPPKTSRTKSRMRIAADVTLVRRYPQSVALNRPESGEGYETPEQVPGANSARTNTRATYLTAPKLNLATYSSRTYRR